MIYKIVSGISGCVIAPIAVLGFNDIEVGIVFGVFLAVITAAMIAVAQAKNEGWL